MLETDSPGDPVPGRRQPGAPPDAKVSGAAGSVAYSLISLLSSGVFTAILVLYLVRALGPSRYGDFALAVSVGALAALPADFGISSSAARFIAEQRSLPGQVATILADAIRLKVIASVLACGALALLAGPIAAAYHAPLAGPLRLIALAVLGQNFLFLFEGAFIATGRMSSYVQIAFGESATECTASIILVLLGGGATAAAAGRTLGYVTGALLALRLGAKTFGWPAALRHRTGSPMTGRLARYAAPLMLVDGANALFSLIDVLLIGAFLGATQTGFFSAPLRLLPFLFYPATAVGKGIGPRMARGSSGSPDGVALAAGLRSLLIFYSLLLAPLIIWTRPVVELLLGHRYGPSVTTMRVLAVCIYLGGIAPVVSVSANYLGDARSRIPLMLGAAVLDGAIDVVLIPRVGIVSGAIATAAAYALMDAGHLAICARHVTIPFRRLGASALRALIAAAAMGAVLWLLGTRPSVPVMVLGAVGGTAVFGVVLVAVGEIAPAELRAARSWIRGRIQRARP